MFFKSIIRIREHWSPHFGEVKWEINSSMVTLCYTKLSRYTGRVLSNDKIIILKKKKFFKLLLLSSK